MFGRAASGSRTPRELSGESGPERPARSPDTGDVLIRSTGVLLPDRRGEAGPGSGSVRITVRKLRDPDAEQRPKPRRKPDSGAPLRAAAEAQPAAEWSPDTKPFAGTQSGQQTGHDLLTSRFPAGGRGVVLAALKQRSHSASCRREVGVTLVDPGPVPTGSHDAAGVRVEAGPSPGRLGDATNVAAAAAAAAVAAAAPLIKAQSDMEARVRQLADGVQRLLQDDREGGARGRGLSQETLQHLEAVHGQQLQLQSQLLESALRIVAGHAPVTSAAPEHAACLRVTHLDDTAGVLSDRRGSRSAAAAAVETGPVAMATPSCDRRPERTRGDRRHQGAASVSTATRPPEGTGVRSSANHSQAARKASEVLREMEHLKTEMKMLLTPEDSLKTNRPTPDHQQSQKSQAQQNHFQSQQPTSQQNQSQSREIQSQKPMSQQNQSQQPTSQQNQSQSREIQCHQSLFQQKQTHVPSQSVLVPRRPAVPSTLEEAGRVLRQVRRRKKVLEENLEALLRAKTGEVLHCQLEALAANRDWSEEVRIKKTVDAWISALSKDIQAPSEDAAGTSHLRAARSSAHSGRAGPVSSLRGTGSKTAAGRGGGGRLAGHRAVQGAEPGRVPGVLTDREQVEGEAYLTRLYGRAPYEGLRRTLKKSPYLRFSSPASPLSRKSRPRLVESVRGVKVKSCKTQTSLAPPLVPSPGRPHRHLLCGSSHVTSGDPADLAVTPADTHSVPTAIPLGRRRMDSRRLAERQQEVTSPPTPPSTCGGVAEVDGAPERPSQREEQLGASEAPPPLPPPQALIETKNEEEEEEEDEEDEENVFPGTDFLHVADVVQEESAVGEEAVELDGGPSPPPVLYQGPTFPPQACSALPAPGQASVLHSDQQRDALENRLVDWVEQQLMSRMISNMYRSPPADPAQNASTDQSELEEQSVLSDIVEAAGGGGLQLFVDSGVSVDSALIRQLVNEVLAETVALMLGQRDVLDTDRESGLEPPKPGPHQEDEMAPPVPTPVPTPPPSPPLPVRQATPPATPPPSEPTSMLKEEASQSITAPEPLATPTPSPEPAPSAGSPPRLSQAPPSPTWGDAELPLDEERPEEHLDPQERPPEMSVAEEEPPLSSPLLLAPSPPPAPPPGPAPPPSPPSPSPPPSSSSSSSSSTVTAETDSALKHISEGELSFSSNLPAAPTGGGEETFVSFSSSLQEVQDVDHDPPSEGQVRGHELLMTLLNNMERGVTHRAEGSWGREEQQEEEEVSVGEVGGAPTTDPRGGSAARQRRRTEGSGSDAWIRLDPNGTGVTEATNQDSVTVGDLTMEPLGTLTSDLHTDLSPSPPAHPEDTHPAGRVVSVGQSHRHTDQEEEEEEEEGGARRVDIHLPSIGAEEEVMEEVMEEVSAAADSSTSDVF